MKRFLCLCLLFAIVFSVICVGLAEEEDRIKLLPGFYIVGKDLEAGSYTAYIDEEEPVDERINKGRKINAAVRVYSNMDDYLWVKDNSSKHVAGFVIEPGLPGHVSLEDGLIIEIVILNGTHIYLKRD